MKVLYVEDNVLDAELARRELSGMAQDLDLDVLHSVDEAVARLGQDGSGYDLVLSDLKLPDGDGLALLARIRERGLPLAVVVISGAGDEQSVIAALRAGADDYVVKDAAYLAHLPATLESALERFRTTQARRGRPIRVLYAEDNALDADIVERCISRQAPHIHLEVVDTPQTVYRRLAEAEQTPYDLMLLDYRLPGTNALDVLRELRQVHKLEVPVVLITGQGDEEVARQAMRLGAADYVIKRGDYANRLPLVLENAFHRAQLAREQAALRKSEERYRNIVELAPDGILTLNLAGMVTSCNSAFVELTGFAEDEIVGRHFSKMPTLHLDDIPGYTRIFAEIVHGRLQHPIEFDWYHKDGSRRGGEARVSLIRDGSRITGVQAIVTDITERRRAERLLEALNRAALAMERALTPDAIFDGVADQLRELGIFCAVFLVDQSGEALIPRYLSYEPGVVRTAETLVGLDAAEFRILVDAVDVFRKAVRKRMASFVADAEGHARQVLPRPLKGFAGQLIRMLEVPKLIAAPLVVQDRVIGLLSVQSADLTPEDVPAVTAFAHQVAAAWRKAQLYEQAQLEIAERLRAEEALRESEERFRALVQNSLDIIAILEMDGTLRYISPSAEGVLGVPAESLLGQNLIEFVHPADVPATQEALDTALQQPGVPVGQALRVRHANGSWAWLELFTNNLVHIPSVRGLVVNGRDITERKRLENQFQQAQKMEAIGRLAGGIAHDFNNLLTAVQGYTLLLLSDLASDVPLNEAWKESICKDLTEVKLASERAAGLTQQLLAFSRRQVLRPRLLDLGDLVLGMENMLRRLIGEDIELLIEPARSLARVLADPVQIEQVIMNLVVNARDAMPHGGRLTIGTANVELDEAFVREHPGSQQGAYVVLSVSDTGIGMSGEVRSHLFEPFYTTKEDGKGTGLGLATVYGIVKQSGGYIWPSSELGQGTSFQIYLPRAEGEDDVPEPGPERSALSSGTETILLVEDEEIVRDLARRILERQGYSVLVAGRPEEALGLSTEFAGNIDLLVTDVVMPGMSGRDLSERLLEARPGTRVLYISGYTDDAIVQHGVLDSGVHFCQKPFRPGDLVRKVREVLDQG